jgi:hypothetical protein
MVELPSSSALGTTIWKQSRAVLRLRIAQITWPPLLDPSRGAVRFVEEPDRFCCLSSATAPAQLAGMASGFAERISSIDGAKFAIEVNFAEGRDCELI